MPMEYEVVEGTDEGEGLLVFIQTVNSFLADGWELQGGVSAVYEPTLGLIEYHQAVYRRYPDTCQLN